MTAFSPWWERRPGCLEEELGALRAAGIDFDQPTFNTHTGVMILGFRYEVGSVTHRFQAYFPSFYPYVRFEVVLEGDPLPRHMNPFQGNLCLIGRNSSNWELDDTLASFIVDRIPRVFEAATSSDPERVAELEEHQGEPFSSYYPYAESSVLLIDGQWAPPADTRRGQLEVAWFTDPASDQPLRGVALKLLDKDGNELGEAARSLQRLAAGRRRERIPWVRLPGPPMTDNPQTMRRIALEQLSSGAQGHTLAITFPEETRWREEGHSWILVTARGRKKQPKKREIIRVQRAGESDLNERSPEFTQLQPVAVALFGLGALGSPAAVSLARAGVGDLRLVDHDIVEAGTVVRWELGLAAAGHPKVALAHHINQNWPHTVATPHSWRVGDPFAGDLTMMKDVLDSVDLVFDATAELGIQYLLSDLAAELGIPYLAATSTTGACGGLIVRLHPLHSEGCWVCHRFHLEGGSIVAPLADPDGVLQPVGCAEPTFTGSNLDLELIANQAARSAIDTLLYAEDDHWWDVAVADLRTLDAHPTPPSWQLHRIPPHPSCKKTHPR